MLVRRWRDALADDDGVTLVELMVSTGLLAIVLTALAGTLIVTLTSVTRSEEEVIATQFAQEVAESLQIGHFDTVALYEDEIDPLTNGLATEWETRLDGSGDFEGGTLVTVAGPVGARDDSYPVPVVVETRSHLEMRVDRYLTWVDRDGDGFVETKRLTSFVTWEDRAGNARELRFDSERVPTQDEATATDSGTRVIQFNFSPDPVELDGEDGALEDTVTIFVRTNEGTRFAEFSLYEYDPVAADFVLYEPTATGVDFGAGADYVTWTATIPQSVVLGNGTVDVRFEALDADGAVVDAVATLDTYGGPYDVTTPTPGGAPAPGPSGSPSPSATPTATPSPTPSSTPADEDALALIITQAPTTFCVSSSQHKLGADIVVNVTVTGATNANANATNVILTYPYKTAKNKTSPDAEGNSAMNEVTVGASSTSYTVTIPENSVQFGPGWTVEFTLRAERDGGATAEDVATGAFSATVTTC